MTIDRRLLSIGLVLVFLGYAYHQQQENNQATSSITANTSPVTPQPTASSTQSSTSGSIPISIAPTSSPTATPTPTASTTGQYKNGTYTGDVADAFYGNVQVEVTVSGGKITNVTFLQHPSDRQTSIEINNQAMPMLSQQAIQAQSSNVDGVSGASATSQAFIQSLGSALAKAQA